MFTKDSLNEEPRHEVIPLKTKSHVVSQYSDLYQILEKFCLELSARLDSFVACGVILLIFSLNLNSTKIIFVYLYSTVKLAIEKNSKSQH